MDDKAFKKDLRNQIALNMRKKTYTRFLRLQSDWNLPLSDTIKATYTGSSSKTLHETLN